MTIFTVVQKENEKATRSLACYWCNGSTPSDTRRKFGFESQVTNCRLLDNKREIAIEVGPEWVGQTTSDG